MRRRDFLRAMLGGAAAAMAGVALPALEGPTELFFHIPKASYNPYVVASGWRNQIADVQKEFCREGLRQMRRMFLAANAVGEPSTWYASITTFR